MARKVFYSFHFKRDAWRAAQVRNSNMIADEDEFGVIDSVDWETIERQGDAAVERWISDQLKYTSVTVVLIGAQTAERDWVDHEIRKSWERGNGLVGMRIHAMKNQERDTDAPGANPFAAVKLADGTPLSSIVKVYDWVTNDGRKNMGDWVEEAYKAREAYDGETKLMKAEVAAPYVRSAPATAPTVVPAPAPSVIRKPAQPWAW